jgi:hypothetical protein
MLPSIVYFCVNEFNPLLSDCHSVIEWQMSANYVLKPEQEIPRYTLQPKLYGFIYIQCGKILLGSYKP